MSKVKKVKVLTGMVCIGKFGRIIAFMPDTPDQKSLCDVTLTDKEARTTNPRYYAAILSYPVPKPKKKHV